MGEHKKNTNYSSMFSEKKKIMILVFLLIVTIAGIITCGYYIYSKIKLDKKYDTQAYAQWVVVVSDNINDSVKWHFEDLSTERIDNSTIKATGNIIGEKESIQQIPLEFKKIDNGEVELIENDDYKVFKEKIQNFISNNSLKADEEKIKKIKIDYRDINRAFLGDDSLVMPDSEVTEITPDGDNDSAYIVKSSMIIPKLGLGEPKFYPIKMKIQYKNGEYNFQYLDDEIDDNDKDDSNEAMNNNLTREDINEPTEGQKWTIDDDGNVYYMIEPGKLAYGWQEINGDKYWFDENGILFKGEAFNVDGEWINIPQSGKNINGETYFFGSDGKLLKNVDFTDGSAGVLYHIGNDGRLEN